MFAVDDELETSVKHEALTLLPRPRGSIAFEVWGRLGAACKNRGNGGAVSRALLAKIMHHLRPAERERAARDLVEARGGRSVGLWVEAPEIDGWRFHGWVEWQPSAEEAAKKRARQEEKNEYQRRWRAGEVGTKNKPPDVAPTVATTESPTPAPTREVREESRRPSLARARSPIPSLSPSLPTTKSARELEEHVARTLCERYREHTGKPWHHADQLVAALSGMGIRALVAAAEQVRALASWCSAHDAPEAALEAVLAAFFADAWASEAGYPIAALVKEPARFLAARRAAQPSPESSFKPVDLDAVERAAGIGGAR